MDHEIEWAVSSTIETTQEFVVVVMLLQIVVGACPLFVGHITSVAFNETKLIHFFSVPLLSELHFPVVSPNQVYHF